MACNAPRLPTIRLEPIPIEVPPAGVQALTTGLIPVGLIQSNVLATITDSPTRDISFTQEYERGPSMTLISIGSSTVAAADVLLNFGAPNALPPLEQDMAFCGSNEVNDVRSAIATAPFYEMPELRVDVTQANPQGTLLGALQRVNGRLTQLSLVPDAPTPPSLTSTTFTLSVTVRDVAVDVEVAGASRFIRAQSISITCPGVITPAAGNTACGDQVVRCLLPTVSIDGYSTDVPYLALVPDPETKLEALVSIGLSVGVKLHFQNFAATSLAFVTNLLGTTIQLDGRSTLMPDGTSVCSPVPPPEPPPAPTRAVTRTYATWGRGEFIGSDGDVMPFDLIPKEDVELLWRGPARSYMIASGTELDRENVFGIEAPPWKAPMVDADGDRILFEPHAISTGLRVTRRVPRECWVKPVSTPLFQELVLSAPHFVESTFPDGKNKLADALPESMKSAVRFLDIREASFEKELHPLIEEAGLSCEKCGAGGWSRVSLVVSGPFGDDRDPRLTPLEIVVWLNREAREIREIFKPSLECGYAQEYQAVVGERRFSDPRVTINPYKIDSMDLSSTALSETDTRGFATRSTISTSSGPAVEIVLTDKCAIDSSNTCWTESIRLPSVGEVAVTDGFSNTTVPRASIRSTTSAAFGSRTVAVQGLFDRSGIAIFTDVPRIYRDIGLTTNVVDYRGTRFFDWGHAPGFDAPGGAAHVPERKVAWHTQSRPFFPNWKTDVVRLSHRATYPMSYCTLPADMYAVPTQLEFTGGGLIGATVVSPYQVFTTPAGTAGDYRISPALSGAASASAFVRP